MLRKQVSKNYSLNKIFERNWNTFFPLTVSDTNSTGTPIKLIDSNIIKMSALPNDTETQALAVIMCMDLCSSKWGWRNQYNSNVKINPPEFRPAESTPDAAELATASQWEVSPRIYWSKRVKMINSFSNWE